MYVLVRFILEVEQAPFLNHSNVAGVRAHARHPIPDFCLWYTGLEDQEFGVNSSNQGLVYLGKKQVLMLHIFPTAWRWLRKSFIAVGIAVPRHKGRGQSSSEGLGWKAGFGVKSKVWGAKQGSDEPTACGGCQRNSLRWEGIEISELTVRWRMSRVRT